MSCLRLFLSLLLAFALRSSFVRSEDDDDEDVKGPLMLKNKDGSLMTTKQQIEARGYKGESYIVTTEDGYMLTLFRIIPARLPAPAVILQHGLLASSDCWVTDNRSLAFTLSDAGYDVWINNARGNCYSRNHTKLNPNKDKTFWDFSWHEMGTKDIPAVIDHVLKTNGETKVHIIGHSMGTIMCLVTMSLKPEYNKKLKSLVLFSPVAFLSKANEMVGPDGMVEAMVTKYMDQFKAADKWEVFPRPDIPTNNQTQVTCNDVEENFQDMCKEKMDMAQEILGGAYFPAGQSMKTLRHFHQLAVAGLMKHYKLDTPEENEKMYGTKEPPSYSEKFKSITTPTLLWSSENDGLVMTKDIDDLKPLMGNVVADYRIPDECFDHMAFAYARKVACVPVREQFYKNVTAALKKLD